MAGSNINVAITADVTDLVAKKAIMSAELKAATADLNAFAREAAAGGGTKEVSAGMLAAAEAATKARAQIAGVNVQLKELQATSATPGIAGQIKGIAEEATMAREAVASLGEALVAAFAVREVVEFAEKIGEAAEKIYHTALTFGMTANEVMKLRGEMVALGIAPEAVTMSFTRLDRATINAREGNEKLRQTFAQLGIDIDKPISQAQLFQETIEGLSKIEDVPTRIGVAMQLLGRNIQDIAPLLGMTTEQINEAKVAVDEYGYANDGAQEAGLRLAEAMNVNHVAMQGLTNVLAEEFGPALATSIEQLNQMIKEFVESYREGGSAKQMLQDLGGVLKALAVFTSDVVAALFAFAEAINATAYLIEAILDPIIETVITLVKELADAWEMTGKVMNDAVHLDWSAIVADFRNGLSQMAEDARKGGENVGNAFNDGIKSAGGALAAGDAAIGAANKLAGGMFGEGGDDKYNPHALDRIMGKGRDAGSNNFDPTAIGGGRGGRGGGKGSKGNDDAAKLAEEEIAADEKAKLALLAINEEFDRKRLALGEVTNERELQNQIGFENDRFKIQRDALVKRAAADAGDKVQHQKDLDAIEQLGAAHELKMLKLQDDYAIKKAAQDRKAADEHAKVATDMQVAEIAAEESAAQQRVRMGQESEAIRKYARDGGR